jgi:hypothetical protein
MRFVSATLCSAALVTLGFVAATPAASLAALDAAAPGGAMMVAPRTATLNGVITGGKGINLSCSGVTAEVHDSTGKVVATAPTTSNGNGGCTFSTKVPANLALTSCAGRVALGAMVEHTNDLNGGTRQTFMMTSRSVVNGHERLGTLGSSHIYSTIASVSAISGNNAGSANITVGAEP